MSAGYAILAFVLPSLPLGVAALLFVPGVSVPARRLAPWLPLTALGLLPLHGRVVEMPWLLLGARVGLDDTALPLLVLAVVVWTLAGAQAAGSLSSEPRGPDGSDPRKGFFCFWLLTWTGNLCVLITLDAASFYAAYALMTFAAYGLIIHRRRPADFRAGRVYMVLALLGESLIIAALLTLGAAAGNVPLEHAGALIAALPNADAIALLLALGFGVKMGLVPLHAWLPLAHPRAPVPASAVLSGVIVKAGLMGWLRFLPLGVEGGSLAGTMLVAGGLFTAFYGVAAGLPQRKPKTVLAYSTVSQMGLIAAAVGTAVLHPEHAGLLVTVATLFALHHGLSKGALFLSVGLPGRAPRLARELVWLPALAIAGAPLTSGALAKVLLKTGMEPGIGAWLEPVLLASTAATTLLVARFLFLARPLGRGANGGPWWPFAALVACAMGLPWLAAWPVNPDWLVKPFHPGYLLDTGLPVIGAALAALLAARWWRGGRWPRIPEGDILALLPSWQGPPTRPARRSRPEWTSAPRLLARAEALLADLSFAFLCWLAVLAFAFAVGWAAWLH